MQNESSKKEEKSDKKEKKEKVKKCSHGLRKTLAVTSGVVVLVIIGFVIVFGVGIYKERWDKKYADNKYFSFLIKYMPYPIMFVDNQVATVSELNANIAGMKHFFTAQYEMDFNSEEGKQSLAEIETRAKEKIKDEKVIKRLLAKNKVKVTVQDVENEYTKYMSEPQVGGEEKGLADFNTQFGWTGKVLVQKYIIRPYVERKNLTEKAAGSDDYKTFSKQKGEKVLGELKENPGNFSSIAAENSDEYQTAVYGGDIGIIAKGNLDPASEEAVFALENNGDMTGLIDTEQGYFMYKLVEKGDKEDERHVARMLFSHFENWLAEQKKQVSIREWL